MKKTSRFLALALTLALLGALCACGGSAKNSSEDEVIFSVGITSSYDTLNFFSTESQMVYDFLNICYDSLIAYDDNYNAIPRLAKSWESNADGTVWTFHLRDDAYFTDGQQVTSADVKWTYEHAGDSYMYSTHANGISSIDCPDDYTVVFNCDAPKPDMLYQIIPILPEHIWSQVDDVLTYDTTELIGSGPFIYSAERSTNGNIAFVRNDKYWGDKPAIDVLVFSLYDNYDSMAQALQMGEIDGCYDLDKSQYDQLKTDSNIYLNAYEGFGFEYLGYNLLDPLLADKTIRYAVDYCMDRDTAIEMGYGGLAEPGYCPINNAGYVYTPTADTLRAFNTDAANDLLDKAGYTDTDGDGIREKDGTPLSFELTTAAERSSWQSAVVNMLIENCAKAGIEITWNAVEKVTMWDTCADGNADWQMILDGWGGDADPGFILCIFQDYNTLGYAGVSYSNPDFDAAYAKAYSTIDPAERLEYLNQCQQILYDDCPYTIICYGQTVQAVNSSAWTGFDKEANGLYQNELITNYLHLTPVA